MIIKVNNRLLNCDGWREISRDDQYVTVEFFEMFTDEDDNRGSYCHVFEIVDDDYYCGLGYKHKDEWDHKDIRRCKYIACQKAYEVLLAEIKAGTCFIDLDVLIDQERLCKEAEEAFIKEYTEDE